MLSKDHKLNSVEFNHVFTTGKTLHSDNFTVKYLINQPTTKAAVVVSKKHSKTAVQRNYKRRVIFHTLSILFKEGVIPNDIFLILILKKNTINVTPSDLYTKISLLLYKI